jgi:hypothetical protein
MKKMRTMVPAVLAMIAGSVASAQAPVIDGSLDASGVYGPLRAVQTQVTRFGDNRPQSGNPGAVTTGIEIAIPLAALGNPTGPIRIAGFINGGQHDFASNQFIGGFATQQNNLGEPRSIDLSTFAGDQFVSVPLTAGASAPVIDGTRDSVYTERFLQTNFTGFGNANQGQPGFTNGSEIDGLYSTVFNGVLYIMVTGNLESNNNDFELFIDTDGAANGQNQLRDDNAVVGAPPAEGGLNRMGGNSGTGLRFDTGFAADYYLTFDGSDDGFGVYQFRGSYGTVPTAGAGVGFFLGNTTAQSNGSFTGGDPGAPAILATIDNSNTGGVLGSPGTIPSPDFANGSELDNLRYVVLGGKLYLFFGGNLESAFNNLDIFFDVVPGGQNTLRGDNVDIDFNGLNRMAGMTFDVGFDADYWFSIRTGGNPIQQFANSATLRTDGPLFNTQGQIVDYGSFSGGEKATNNPIPFPSDRIDPPSGSSLFTTGGPRLAQCRFPTNPGAGLLKGSINNLNTAGVTGPDAQTPSVADAPNVNTGIEIEIDLTELGWDGVSPVKMIAMINGGGHSFVSNQVIPGLPGGPLDAQNLGDPNAVNFQTIAGDQFVTIITTGACPGTGPGACGAGDWNEDGTIDFNDLLAFLNDYNANANQACPNSCVDLNGDGAVDFNDFLEFLNRYNTPC